MVRSARVTVPGTTGYATIRVNLVNALENPEKLQVDVYSVSSKNRVRRLASEILGEDGHVSFSIPKSVTCDRFYAEIKSMFGWSKHLIYRVGPLLFSFVFEMVLIHFL